MSQNKNNGFIMQAGILAAAGIIVRIIGILYRSPLVAIIGDEGNGYYNTAYIIYTIILLVSSYSIPSATSKVIAARLALKEYRNAYRLFIGSVVYVLVVGGIASIVCFIGAEWFVGVSSARVLRIFAPTIFFSGLLGAFRGYFQAHRTMVQTSISQILEQILNAVISILAAFLLMKMVAGQDTTTQAIYGAMGSALGTGSGVMIALLFMLLVYLLNRKMFQRRMAQDTTKQVLSSGEIMRIIFGMVTPVVLSTCIYNLSTASNLKIYQEIMQLFKGFTEEQATTGYGLFSGKAMQIVNIPIALASAMSAAIIPTIASTYEKKEFKETNKKIAKAIKVTMMISIPSAFGLAALAKPIAMLLYPQRASVDIVSQLIQVLSITVIFYGLSTLSNAVLQGTGNVNTPVINALISLILQAGVLVALLMFTKLNLFSLCIATIIYSFSMCILNGIAVRNRLHYRQEIMKTFILPLAASFWMGLTAFFANFGLNRLIRLIYNSPDMEIAGINNAICLFISVMVAAAIYFILVIKLGVISKKEMKELPKGQFIYKISYKLHFIK